MTDELHRQFELIVLYQSYPIHRQFESVHSPKSMNEYFTISRSLYSK